MKNKFISWIYPWEEVIHSRTRPNVNLKPWVSSPNELVLRLSWKSIGRAMSEFTQ